MSTNDLVVTVFSERGANGKIMIIDFGDSKIVQDYEFYDEFVGTIHVTSVYILLYYCTLCCVKQNYAMQ